MATAVVVGSIAATVIADQAAATGAARAGTSPPMTVYVDQRATNCTNSGPGSQAVPYCTLQYAANVAVPGQAIIAGDLVGGTVTFTHSGTPSAPITIVGHYSALTHNYEQPAPVIFDNVHDINVSGLGVLSGYADGIDVIGSQDITIDSSTLSMNQLGGRPTPTAAVRIDGASSNITVSRSVIMTDEADGIQVASGASNVTITTNRMNQFIDGTPVVVTGATGVNVTSNYLMGDCHDGVVLTNTSSATIENNIIVRTQPNSTCPSAVLSAVSVDADTAATARSDYNYIPESGTGSAAYSWAGTSYQDEATFNAATGQGAHDTITTPTGLPAGESGAVDSADCTAPGELDTDINGNPHVDDPLVPNTGNGTCYADRGAQEAQDSLTFGYAVSQSAPTTDGTVTVQLSNAPATSPWSEPVTYTANWGDGSSGTIAPNGAVTHQYTTAGAYTITLTAADTGGSKQVYKPTVAVYSTTPPALTLTASTRNSAGAIAADTATFTGTLANAANAFEVKSAQITCGGAFYDVLNITLTPSGSTPCAYLHPGTFTATLTVTDVLGRTSTATATVSVGNLIRMRTPVVDYAQTVPAHGSVALGSTHLHVSSADWAALVTATVTSATKAGYVTVYPTGTARPNQATVQFGAGQPASNVTLATITGPDGTASFYNGSSAPITLTITTIGAEPYQGTTGAGLWQATTGDMYVPVAPASVLAPFKVAPNQNALAAVAGSHGVPANAAAVVLDVTASGGTAAGHVTSYPERLSSQQQQGAYWVKGQTVTSLAVVPADGRADLHNASSGTVSFSAQVVGYFVPNGPGPGAAFFPSSRARVLAVTLAGRQSVTVPVTGKNGVPTGSDAVMVNLTALNAAAPGSITAWADGTARPAVTSISYTNGQTNVGAAIVAVGTDGGFALYNNGTRPVTVVVDLLGSFDEY